MPWSVHDCETTMMVYQSTESDSASQEKIGRDASLRASAPVIPVTMESKGKNNRRKARGSAWDSVAASRMKKELTNKHLFSIFVAER